MLLHDYDSCGNNDCLVKHLGRHVGRRAIGNRLADAGARLVLRQMAGHAVLVSGDLADRKDRRHACIMEYRLGRAMTKPDSRRRSRSRASLPDAGRAQSFGIVDRRVRWHHGRPLIWGA